MQKRLSERARDWDDYVEDHDREGAVQPFDAGLVLACATLLDAWDEDEGAQKNSRDAFRDAIKGIQDTLDAFVDEYAEDDGADTE